MHQVVYVTTSPTQPLPYPSQTAPFDSNQQSVVYCSSEVATASPSGFSVPTYQVVQVGFDPAWGAPVVQTASPHQATWSKNAVGLAPLSIPAQYIVDPQYCTVIPQVAMQPMVATTMMPPVQYFPQQQLQPQSMQYSVQTAMPHSHPRPQGVPKESQRPADPPTSPVQPQSASTLPWRPVYKTKLCRGWLAGGCTYGDKCMFAHGKMDMVTVANSEVPRKLSEEQKAAEMALHRELKAELRFKVTSQRK